LRDEPDPFATRRDPCQLPGVASSNRPR
jgi:hypothetical protein